MDISLLYRLACILLIPLLPAFLLYTKLPSRTAVGGPFKGLNIKLSGAFSGYFLLVLLAISVMAATDRRTDLKMEIQNLKHQLDSQQAWTVEGQLKLAAPQETKIFVSGNAALRNTIFNVSNIYVPSRNGKINMALCFYNKSFGYRILNIDENFPAAIDTLDIRIDKAAKLIHIEKPVSF